MRTAALVFFCGCLCAGLWWAFAAWTRRTVTRHVDAALDPRIDRGLEMAANAGHFARWEAELNDRFQWPYDQEVQGS